MSKKLVKELEKVQKKEEKVISKDQILKEAETLLLDAYNDDNEVLKQAGLNHQVEYARELQYDVTRTKQAREKYAKSVYTGSQIKELCNKYDLRLRPAKDYNGSIPVDLARKIKGFLADNDIELRQNSLYILAPVEQFKNIKHVPVQADPILFYREGSGEDSNGSVREAWESDRFINVHNWGNDFTFIRKFRWLINPYYRNSEDISNAVRAMLIGLVFLVTLMINFFSSNIEVLVSANIVFGIFISIALAFSLDSKANQLNHLWNDNRV